MQSLPGFTRQKTYRKRASGRARLVFPGGFKLAVSMYSLVQPATKGSPVFLNAVNNEPLKVESAFIDQDTGTDGLLNICGLPNMSAQLQGECDWAPVKCVFPVLLVSHFCLFYAICSTACHARTCLNHACS